MNSAAPYALEARGLVKRFGAVVANKGIDLCVERGSIHGIIGENGAGKSTLLNMLFGFYQPDEGALLVGGERVSFKSAADGLKAGIGMVHQHFMLIEPFTVLENLMLGADGGSGFSASAKAVRAKLKELDERFGFGLNPNALISDLSVGQKQRLEIVKALYKGAETLILDEPTAVLTPQECDQLFTLLRQLRDEGVAILFVTHKLHEILALADRATVIRDGEVIAHVDTADATAAELAELMVGKRVARQVNPAEDAAGSDILLQAENLSLKSPDNRALLANISLSVKAGEIVGIAGVAGNGQTELLEVLAGMAKADGTIAVKGESLNDGALSPSPEDLRQKGVVHIPEDRLRHAVVEEFSAADNIMLGYSAAGPFVSNAGVIQQKAVKQKADLLFDAQDVRPRDPSLPVGSFSGGNQQKIVIARELDQAPDILLIGQPTRGVDIGAATLIHDQLMALRNSGKAVLLVSADLDELIQLSDRILVMLEGKIVGDIPVDEADAEKLGLMMAGSEEDIGAPA